MQQSKAHITYYHNEPQYHHLYETCTSIGLDTYLSTKAKNKDHFALIPNDKIIIDRYDFSSSLNGTLSSFEALEYAPLLVLAIDLPFIEKVDIKFLLQHREPLFYATG